MKTEHMKEFVELSKSRSFSRTAEKFFISQSALSKHMASIEMELNAALFDHSGYGVVLSDEGKYVAEEFERVLTIMAGMEHRLKEIRMGIGGSLKISILYYAAEYYLPILNRFRTAYPHIHLHTFSGQPGRIYDEVLTGKTDAGFLVILESTKEQYGKELSILPLYKEKSVVLCRDDSPLAAKEAVFPIDLNGQTFMRYRNGSFMETYNNSIQACLQNKGAAVNGSGEFDNIDFLTAAIQESQGFCIFPAHVGEHHNRLASVPLRDFPAIQTCIFSRKDNRNPSLELFKSSALKTPKIR